MRILIIDDNVDSATALALCLQSQGYDVHIRFTGEDGIATARKLRPGVILLDIGLPDIDGYEVARTLRQDYEFDEVAIIALTGYGGEASKSRAEAVGFNHYLVKPVNFSRLQDLLSNHVSWALTF